VVRHSDAASILSRALSPPREGVALVRAHLVLFPLNWEQKAFRRPSGTAGRKVYTTVAAAVAFIFKRNWGLERREETV